MTLSKQPQPPSILLPWLSPRDLNLIPLCLVVTHSLKHVHHEGKDLG